MFKQIKCINNKIQNLFIILNNNKFRIREKVLVNPLRLKGINKMLNNHTHFKQSKIKIQIMYKISNLCNIIISSNNLLIFLNWQLRMFKQKQYEQEINLLKKIVKLF